MEFKANFQIIWQSEIHTQKVVGPRGNVRKINVNIFSNILHASLWR